MSSISFRPFRNTDPPALARIWSNHPPLPGLVQPMSTTLLERFVLSKPFFDRHGLIVATESGEPVGFVHAGFGASADFTKIDRERGVTCMLMVEARADRAALSRQLLEASECYLVERGAQELYGGSIPTLNPFYHGLYGSSDLPGILAGDEEVLSAFRAADYEELQQSVVLERRLSDFRAPMDRQQMQVRRQFHVEAVPDPPPAHWWEACRSAAIDRIRFSLQKRGAKETVGQATLCDMEPLGATWRVMARELLDLQVPAAMRRQGLATFLLSEVFRDLHKQGVEVIQAQASQQDTAMLALYRKLGFREVNRGIAFRKRRDTS